MHSKAEQGRIPLLVSAPPAFDAGIDYELFLDCVHCGLCTSACPTYVELGDENDSPRGRIYLMRAVTDGRLPLDDHVRNHLDLCLDCRACESACPSGVQYSRLIEPFRLHLSKMGLRRQDLGWLQRWLLFGLTPYAGRMRLALAPARLLQWSGLERLLDRLGFFRWLPRPLQQVRDMLPPLRAHYGRLPGVLPPLSSPRARVALFVGCAADAFFPQTTLATARVLQANGCEVWVPRGQACCGALHYHGGDEQAARWFASRNCQAFKAMDLAGVDAVVVNAAGCSAMLKDYGHLCHNSALEEPARKFAAKVKDVSEFLMELGPVKPPGELKLRATYHDACHLCHGQQIRRQPRQLLEMIPGLELIPLNESEICCGAAGSYQLTQPDMAGRLGRRKAYNLLASGAAAVFTSNVGCLLQIGRYVRQLKPDMWVGHVVDALWASYQGK